MNPSTATRALAIAVLGLAVSPATATPPQIQAAPPPVMQNPRAQSSGPGQPGKPHHELYTALEFNVRTGEDDLRSYSAAWVDLSFPSETTQTFPSQTTQKCVLHDPAEDSWDTGSTHHGHQCILATPKTWAQLRAARMFLNFDGRLHQHPYDTGDNWDVNEVRVIAIDPADKNFPCLLDARSVPLLVRMTGSQKKFELNETVNHC
jgi:hypothetical protein